MAGKDDIQLQVAALSDLSRDQLVALWRKTFRVDAPRGVHKGLLIRAAAFHLQQKHFGGLSGEAKRLLKSAMRETTKTMVPGPKGTGTAAIDVSGLKTEQIRMTSVSVERRPTRPGARLIRDWNGKSHVVDVVDGGFIYAGNRYRSLSKIAGEITGTNWSGPRFFGL